MKSVPIAIQDACIIIDLIKLDLFEQCMKLTLNFFTTTLVADEIDPEQWEAVKPHITFGNFAVINSTGEELQSIYDSAGRFSKLSVPDCSVIFHAEKSKAIVLSSDKHVLARSKAVGLESHGLLWVLDELISRGCTSRENGIRCLTKLMGDNRPLPKDECEKRLKVWAEN